MAEHTIRTAGEWTADRGPEAVHSRLLEDRIVVVGGRIDDALANLVTAQLLHLDARRPGEDIHLYLNSPGGSATALLAVYDAMQSLTSDVATACVGQAASVAAVLLAAGAPGKRSALRHARILLHQPSAGAAGRAVDLEVQAREVGRQRRLVEEVLARHTGQPTDRVARDLERGLVLTAEEARSYGLIDRVAAGGQGLRLLPGDARPPGTGGPGSGA